MEQAGRFLWLPWLKGTSFARATPCHGDASCWNGEHDGYRRLSDPVTHRRGLVRLGADHWLVVDALCGMKSHPYRLHWLLRDALFDADNEQGTIKLQTSVGEWSLAVASSEPESTFDVVRADADSPRGWRSIFYHSREPALSVSLVATARSVVFATLLGPRSQTPKIQGDRIFVQGSDWDATVCLSRIEIDGVPLISSIITVGQLANVPSVAIDDSLMPQSEFLQCTSC